MQKVQTPHNNLVSGAAPTTASTSVTFHRGDYNGFVAHLNVTATGGTTPTLNVKFQDSPDNGVTWYDIPSAAFTQVTTSNGQQRLVVQSIANLIQAVVTLGGTTPSYTMALDVTGIL